MRYFLLLLSTIFIVSCADSHQILRASNTSVNLNPQASAYISLSHDGRYGNTSYSGSAATVSQIILLALSKHLTEIDTAHEYESFKEALNTAKRRKVTYLIFPSILEWEDRATEWSGIPDRATVKLAIIQTSSGKTIDSVIIKGVSGLSTFGGDHPQDLLKKPLTDYVKTLF